MPVDESSFRRACGHFATGVSIVTMIGADGAPHGLTANSFTSVSVNPPLVLVCVDRSITTYPAIQQAEGWMINVLTDQQEELCRRFATPDIDKFAGVSTEAGPYGSLRLPGSLAYIAVRGRAEHDGGDHGIFVGEVTEVEVGEGEPLIFYRGMYGLPGAGVSAVP
ncbi:MAG TPA: flavin reductase family protein [Candidatus Dormibacteraeota bacterium]|jgi:3-hydroxy-9,10-secoandrosta-1,3,5(10)-triene-9,17-dione monooxygenase reductase component